MKNINRITKAFAMCAATAVLTSCFANNPYKGEEAKDAPNNKGISLNVEPIDYADYAETLPDGVHIMHVNSENLDLLVIKDETKEILPPNSKVRGYMGITVIDSKYVPNRSADRKNGKISLWTIMKGDYVDSLRDGMYNITVPGKVLNGEDLTVLAIKDSNVGAMSYQAKGYFGITVR